MRVKDKRDYPAGTIVRFEHRSHVLVDNPWGDPEVREVAVYLPHDYQESGEPFIALWDLAAYTNSGPGHLNWRNQGENLVERLDRLVLPPRALLEARRLVAQFQRFHLGLELRSERFLEQMLSAASAPGPPPESARR